MTTRMGACRSCGATWSRLRGNVGQPPAYCSTACRVAAKRAYSRRSYLANRSLLSSEERSAKMRAAANVRVPSSCIDCAAEFMQNRTFAGRSRCPDCQRRHENGSQRKRLRHYRVSRGDLSAVAIAEMKAAAGECPLCGVEMVDESHRPASKELDHIVPLSAGGAHRRENVRIICKSCNAGRPRDASDVDANLLMFEVVA